MTNKPGRPQTMIDMDPECIRLILLGIEEMKSQSQIARELYKQFNLSLSGMRKRVTAVWEALAAEAKEDMPFERAKVSQALLNMYREAKEEINLESILQALEEHNVPIEHRWRILAKWDPYKGANIVLKTLDQYSKLNGLNAPEKSETVHKHESIDPLSMTPQEKHKRIAELLQKRELKGPESAPHKGPGRPSLKN